MVVDPCSKNIFFIDSIAQTINVISPSGEFRKTLAQAPSEKSNNFLQLITQELTGR